MKAILRMSSLASAKRANAGLKLRMARRFIMPNFKCYNCGLECGGMTAYQARNSKCPRCGGDWNPCHTENKNLQERFCHNCSKSQGTMTYYDFRNSKCGYCGAKLA